MYTTWGQMVASKNFMYLFSHKHDFGISAEMGVFCNKLLQISL